MSKIAFQRVPDEKLVDARLRGRWHFFTVRRTKYAFIPIRKCSEKAEPGKIIWLVLAEITKNGASRRVAARLELPEEGHVYLIIPN